MCGCSKDSLILIPFRLPQISCFTLRLKYFSSDSDNCPNVGIRPLLQFPYLQRAGSVLLTFLFFPVVPSSYRGLRGSILSFPLVRYSCPLSAGMLHALMCLKVYSWCIWGERYTPRPPTPQPPCSLQGQILMGVFFCRKGWQDSGMRQPGRLWGSHNWAHYPTACSSMGKTEIPPARGCHPDSHIVWFPWNWFLYIDFISCNVIGFVD